VKRAQSDPRISTGSLIDPPLISGREAGMFEAVQFIESPRGLEQEETVLGDFAEEMEAVAAARSARSAFTTTGGDLYAWWIVRKRGEPLASFIADSKSEKEFVLDLRSGELVELPS
jgi:hypothetical protein